jgi:hypothetical protein
MGTLDPTRVLEGGRIYDVCAQEGEMGAGLMLLQTGNAVIEFMVAILRCL